MERQDEYAWHASRQGAHAGFDLRSGLRSDDFRPRAPLTAATTRPLRLGSTDWFAPRGPPWAEASLAEGFGKRSCRVSAEMFAGAVPHNRYVTNFGKCG